MPMWTLAAVCLRLGDAPPNDNAVVEPTAKPRADKRLCHRHHVNRIVLCRQSSHIVFGQNLHAPISLSPTSSFLLYPNELVRIIAAPSRFGKKFSLRGFWQARRARENPEIVRTAAADEGVGIVLVDQHHAVVGVERTEERDAQESGRVCLFSLPDCRLRLAVFDSGVNDLDRAVRILRIVGLRLLHAALEAMVEPGDLIPLAEIAAQVKRRHRRIVHLRNAHTPRREREGCDEDDSCKWFHCFSSFRFVGNLISYKPQIPIILSILLILSKTFSRIICFAPGSYCSMEYGSDRSGDR